MRTFNFNEWFELKGYWYLPNLEECEQLAGTLKYNEDGINLELFGCFRSEPQMKMDTENIALVHGGCEGGVLITLMDGFEIARRNSYIIITKLTFNTMLIGKFYHSKQDMIFHSAQLSFSNLSDWSGRSVFSQQVNRQAEGRTATITHVSPEVIAINVPSIDSVINCTFNVTLQGATGERSIKHEEILEIVPTSPQTFVWFETKIYELQGLLSFLMDRTVNFKKLSFYGELVTSGKARECIHLLFSRTTNYVEKTIRADELFIPLVRGRDIWRRTRNTQPFPLAEPKEKKNRQRI